VRNAPMSRTLAAPKPLSPQFAGWRRCGALFVDLPYYPAGSRKMLFLGAFSMVVCVDYVVG